MEENMALDTEVIVDIPDDIVAITGIKDRST